MDYLQDTELSTLIVAVLIPALIGFAIATLRQRRV